MRMKRKNIGATISSKKLNSCHSFQAGQVTTKFAASDRVHITLSDVLGIKCSRNVQF